MRECDIRISAVIASRSTFRDDFQGYTFRYERDLKRRVGKYLNRFPSKKAVQRERKKPHEMTSHQCFKPIPILIGELNRHLRGWANYFSVGYPMSVYCEIDRYVQGRLIQHLRACSRRPYRLPQAESRSGHLERICPASMGEDLVSGRYD